MSRPRKPAHELEAILLADIRQMRHCDQFGHVGIAVYPGADPETGANWALALVDYGGASPSLADAALAVATDRLQREYDAIARD